MTNWGTAKHNKVIFDRGNFGDWGAVRKSSVKLHENPRAPMLSSTIPHI